MKLVRFVFKLIVGALGILLGFTAVITILLAIVEGDAQSIYLLTIAVIFGVPTWICFWLYRKIGAADSAQLQEQTQDHDLPEQPSVTVRMGEREVTWLYDEYPTTFVRRWVERAESLAELVNEHKLTAQFSDESFNMELCDRDEVLPRVHKHIFRDDIDCDVQQYFEISMGIEEYEMDKYRPIYVYSATISVEVFDDEQRYVNKTLISEDSETADIRTVKSVINKYVDAKETARKILRRYYEVDAD